MEHKDEDEEHSKTYQAYKQYRKEPDAANECKKILRKKLKRFEGRSLSFADTISQLKVGKLKTLSLNEDELKREIEKKNF